MGLFSEVLELGTGSLVNTGRQWRFKKKNKKKKPRSALLAVLIKERPTLEHLLAW